MVMRNWHDGTNTPEWWDDLPPAMRKRFTNSPRCEYDAREALIDCNECEPGPHRTGVVRDLSRLGMLFLIVALANILFLLIALSFLSDRGAARAVIAEQLRGVATHSGIPCRWWTLVSVSQPE